MATVAQIVDKALDRLGVLGTGQTSQSEDVERLTAAYNEVYAALSAKNLTTWDIDEQVPDEYVNPVVSMVAFARVDDYSVPDAKYQRITIANSAAIPEIRELQADNVYETQPTEYF